MQSVLRTDCCNKLSLLDSVILKDEGEAKKILELTDTKLSPMKCGVTFSLFFNESVPHHASSQPVISTVDNLHTQFKLHRQILWVIHS